MAFPTTDYPVFTWSNLNSKLNDLKMMPLGAFAGPAVIFSKITPDATGLVPFPQGPTRGIFADTAGTVTGHDAFGNAVATFPLQPGYNPISLAGVTSIATTTQVWGVW